MGRGSAAKAIGAALGALGIALLAGCGAQSHPNMPRPPAPAEITVNISDSQVQVQPDNAGLNNTNRAQISQNANVREPQADPRQPLVVNFTISNTTASNTVLAIRGAQSARSGPIVANGTATYKVALPTGDYTISAGGIPAAQAAVFTVGPLRTSSQNQLLLP